jgi:hypothetical protein
MKAVIGDWQERLLLGNLATSNSDAGVAKATVMWLHL